MAPSPTLKPVQYGQTFAPIAAPQYGQTFAPVAAPSKPVQYGQTFAPIAAPSPAPKPSFADDAAGDTQYQQDTGEQAQARSDAAANYLESLKSKLFGFGSEALARATFAKILPQLRAQLGDGINLEPWFQSFKGQDNPDTGFSQIAQFEHGARDQLQSLNEDLNSQNLWFSGHRVKQLGNFDYNKQAAYGDLLAGIQSGLGSLAGDFQGALGAQRAASAASAQEALTRLAGGLKAGQVPVSSPKPKAAATKKVTVKAKPRKPVVVKVTKLPLLRAR